jgi:hypothetical protein
MSDPKSPESTPSEPSQEAHPVTDRYVARRLAEGEAAREARQQQAGENLVGEPPTQGAFLFYLLLGLLISLLLLVVIFRASEPPAPPDASPPAVTSPR